MAGEVSETRYPPRLGPMLASFMGPHEGRCATWAGFDTCTCQRECPIIFFYQSTEGYVPWAPNGR